jgi:hypothetical protein
MLPICATLVTLACLGPGPGTDGPPGLTPHVAGRFGVLSESAGETRRSEPFAALRLGLTWRHQFDNGTRVALTVEAEGATRNAPRPWLP